MMMSSLVSDVNIATNDSSKCKQHHHHSKTHGMRLCEAHASEKTSTTNVRGSADDSGSAITDMTAPIATTATACTQVHEGTHAHARPHAHARTPAHAHAHTHTRARMRARAYIYIYIYIHTHTHTFTHTHTQTQHKHTHTHTQTRLATPTRTRNLASCSIDNIGSSSDGTASSVGLLLLSCNAVVGFAASLVKLLVLALVLQCYLCYS